MKICLLIFTLFLIGTHINVQDNILGALKSPIIFKGNDSVAFRDPAILFHADVFHLFFTLVRSEGGLIYSYTAFSKSKDLRDWSPVRIITPRDQSLNFCSPGNVVRFENEWILCLQTYPRPGLTRSRSHQIWIFRCKGIHHAQSRFTKLGCSTTFKSQGT